MTLSISPVTQTLPLPTATLDAALQPGTIVTAQVLKLLDANLVRIAIQNLTLDVATTAPLQPGQTLQFTMTQTKDGVSLSPVSPVTASAPRGDAVITDDIPLASRSPPQTGIRPVLSVVEARAVSAAAQVAVTKQSGLSPLFANLTSAIVSDRLPQPVLLAATQVLALRQPSDATLTGADIKTALASSGLLLESSLAATALAQAPAVPALPDLKAALTILRQALATWLTPAGEVSQEKSSIPQAAIPQPASGRPTTPGSQTPDRPVVAASLATIAAEIKTGDPVLIAKALVAGQPSQAEKILVADSTAPTATRIVIEDSHPPARRFSVPPPFRGALPAAQPVASPTLAPDAEPVVVARQLIAETDGALARQTLLQVASLPDRVDMALPRQDTSQPRWNFEIPFVTPQGTAMAQFEISRDGQASEVEAAKRVWRARFSLDIEPAGPVHALISFSGDTTSVKMWAERPATAATLRANAIQLGTSLDRAALKAGDIIIADGAPALTARPSAGHFLNRAT